MEIESVFVDSKWRILTELAHSSLSPTDLSKKTGTSMANISAQLRLLEALDFIGKEKLNNVGKGEPRKLYSLKKEFAYLILATKSVIGKKMFKLDQESMMFVSVWMIPDSYAPYLLVKLYFNHEALLKDSTSIGYLGMRGEELEIVIIHDHPEQLSILNDKQVARKDKIYKIKAHVHSMYDFENGVKNEDEYFTSIIKKVFIIKDKDNFLSKLKKGG